MRYINVEPPSSSWSPLRYYSQTAFIGSVVSLGAHKLAPTEEPDRALLATQAPLKF